MRFSNRLFLGESIKDDPSRIIRKLKKKRFMSGVYLICPASNGVDPLVATIFLIVASSVLCPILLKALLKEKPQMANL